MKYVAAFGAGVVGTAAIGIAVGAIVQVADSKVKQFKRKMALRAS